MKDVNIRECTFGDVPALQIVVRETELFPAALLPDMLEAALSGDERALWLALAFEGKPVGLCYAAEEDLAPGAWNMRALAVRPALQGRGFGRALVAQAEAALAADAGRVLLVDTSSTAKFAPARAFYAQNGYVEEARIRDFWGEGDDKVTFRKAL